MKTIGVDAIELMLGELRVNPGGAGLERSIGDAIESMLIDRGWSYRREAVIGPRMRVDFLVGSVAVEIKRGKPNSTNTLAQLVKYAGAPHVDAVVLVVERNIFTLPDSIDGKPVRYVSLSSNWGIAL